AAGKRFDTAQLTKLRLAPLAELARTQGVEFILATSAPESVESWGVENADALAAWTRRTAERFQALGESLELGAPGQVDAATSQRHVVVARRGERAICLGLNKTLAPELLQKTIKTMLLKWAS